MAKYRNGSITFGTDIEYILSDEHGTYRAAIPFIEGSKAEPQLLRGGNAQKDNVAFEVAIDYSAHPNDVICNMGKVLHGAYTMIPEGWELNAIPSALFPDEELIDPIAKEFGCDPDFDAKTGHTNVMDVSGVHPNFRSFGLHVHTGRRGIRVDKTHELARYHVIASDFVLGLFSTIVDNSKAALERRKLYGKPSAYRMKPYGVEYRTLSNFWSKSPILMELLINLNDYTSYMAAPTIIAHKIFSNYDIYNLAQIIKDGDKAAAYTIWMNDVYPELKTNDRELVKQVLKTDSYGSLKEEWSKYMVDTPRLKDYWTGQGTQAEEALYFRTEEKNGMRYQIVDPLTQWAYHNHAKDVKVRKCAF